MSATTADNRRVADPRTLPTWVVEWPGTVTRNYGRRGGWLQSIGHIVAAIVSGRAPVDLCVWRDRHRRRAEACTFIGVVEAAAMTGEVNRG